MTFPIDTRKDDIMKTTPLLLCGLLSVFTAGAFAQGYPGEASDIRDAHHAIYQSHRAIASEQRNLAHDKRVAQIETQQALQVQRRQDAAIARGDYRSAHKLDKLRRHEADEAKIAQRQVSHDRNVIAIERWQIDHQRNVIAIERRDRAYDTADYRH